MHIKTQQAALIRIVLCALITFGRGMISCWGKLASEITEVPSPCDIVDKSVARRSAATVLMVEKYDRMYDS